jgi:hypothetical protein
MIYRELDFLRAYDLAPPPTPPPSSVSKVSLILSLSVCRWQRWAAILKNVSVKAIQIHNF